MNIFGLSKLGRGLVQLACGGLLYGALGLVPAHALLAEFELDTNVADVPAGPPNDWENFTGAPATYPTARATGILSDSIPAVFRNGSKDTQDVSAWRYDLGSSPPKDDMLHAYAAAYTAAATTATTTVGDLLIYFGADRASFSGTASLGFWFFKSPVERDDATGRFVNPVTGGAATHTEGDTLLAFEYTNGGAVTSVRVFRWESGALADKGTIGVSPTGSGAMFCDAADKLCGGTNPSSLGLSWNGTIAAGQFFEGGVNITKEFTGGDNCFASFMATSRSSSTANASIKNFLVGKFPVCSIDVTKVCDPANSGFDAATNKAVFGVKGYVLNDGGGVVTNVTLSDNPAFDAGSLAFYTCDANGEPTGTSASPASLAANAKICYRAKTTTSTFSLSDTVTASASTGGGGTTSDTASASCSITPPPLGLSVTKTCDVDVELVSGKLALKVNYGGSVTNTGGALLKDVKVCETHEIALNGADPCDVAGAVVISLGDMAAGAVKPYSSSYYPSQLLNGSGVSVLTTPHEAVFKDQVGARGTRLDIFGGGTEKAGPQEATCPLCQ